MPNTPLLVNDTDTFSITHVPGAEYLWTHPADWTAIGSTTDDTLIVSVGGSAYVFVQVCVTMTIQDCTLDSTCATLWVDGSVDVEGQGTNDTWFTVHPNPSAGVFQVTPGGSHSEPTELRVYDALGHLVAGPVLLNGPQTYALRLEGQSSGVYFMRALRGAEIKVVELLIQR